MYIGYILGIYIGYILGVYLGVYVCGCTRRPEHIVRCHSLKVVDFLCDRVSHGLELFK